MNSFVNPCAVMFAIAAEACSPSFAARESQPVRLKVALELVERELREVAPVALSDANPGLDPGGTLGNEIVKAQCKNHSANPVIAVLNGPFTLALQGAISLAGSGGFTVSAAPPFSGSM